MAALEQTELVTITINDVELQVPKGELIVESVKRLGLEIPIFCYHPRMKPVGMCRMCLVDVGYKQPDGSVRKMPKPQAGCTLPADNNLVIYTDTEQVHRDRKGVLEFLLINHPLDCPICDRGGECPLQNNTLAYGPSTSRFIEVKRHLPKAYPLSKYVTLDLERCIQCGRCVRFTEEISGDANLAFRFRGASMQPSTFQLLDFESRFSGNVIEICPVGALTSSKYRFRARPWDLETKSAICTNCSNGCNIWLDHRAGKAVRVNGRTNEAVNEEWTCDKGKFGHDWYNSEKRLQVPLIRKGDQFVQCTWAEAYEAILAAFAAGGTQVAGLVGGTVSNEGLYLFKRMFNEVFNSQNIDHRWTKHLPSGPSSINPTSIQALESKRSIMVFGSNLADESPIVYLRMRKAWFKNLTDVVVFCDHANEAEQYACLPVRYKPGTEFALAAGLLREAVQQGRLQASPELWSKIEEFTPEKVERVTTVAASDLQKAIGYLQGPSALLTTHSLLNVSQAPEVLELLQALAGGVGAEFNCLALGANDKGAEAIGVVPGEGGLDTEGILDAASRARIEALWLVEGDPVMSHHDRGQAIRAMENVSFLVYQGTMETETMNFASVVLPMEAPAEQDGTYTNVEGRVQRMSQVLQEPGDSKQAWRVFGEIMLRAKPIRPYFNAKEVMDEIVAKVPAFAGANFENLEREGRRTGLPSGSDELVEVN